jgi:NAD(P)H-hydrate epimerase
MKLATSKEMQIIDNLASSEYKISSLILMENAGVQVTQTVKHFLGKNVGGRKVMILVGKGNNGGDGLVVARHLVNAGVEVKVFLLVRSEEIKGDARTNLEILRHLPVSIITVIENRDLNVVRLALLSADLIVDAIYGTGFKGEVPLLVAQVIRLVNNRERSVIAIDVPSGLEADTGRVHGEAIRATCTVTLALPKLGLVLEPGAGLVGDLIVADISIPKALIDSQNIKRTLLDGMWCLQHLVKRRPEEHKGNYGHVLVLGGSEGLTGAVVLAGEAALRTGAGLVTVGVPVSLNSIIENKLTEVMSFALPETANKTLDPNGLLILENLFKRVAVVAVGPGMSRYPEAPELVRELLKMVSVPVIIDADGLNAVAEDVSMLKAAQFPVVLTPHPGEMSKLMGVSIEEIQENRIAAAKKAATQWGVIVVLKGNRTIVATPDEQIYVNTTGNPGMATGGTGDVLTGIIAGLIAQGLEPVISANLGVYVHGVVGDRVREVKGMRGLIASDLIQQLPGVLRELEEEAV